MIFFSPRCSSVIFSCSFQWLNVTFFRKHSLFCKMTESLSIASALGIQKYPKKSSKFLQYGTAGFRDKATELAHVMYRMGLLAVLRSKIKSGGTVGLMITASHNPEADNGIKLCDPDGKMLTREWEILATDLVNADDKSVSGFLLQILSSHSVNEDVPARVFLARDTRTSSEYLSNAALDGVKVLNGEAKDFGLLTTPQLHFVVFCKNYSFYGTPTPEGYYEKLYTAFKTLTSDGRDKHKKYNPELYVDGANGVGALKMKEFMDYLNFPKVVIFNDGTKGVLNHKCGADFVKVEQKPPEGCDLISGKRYASLDGDADRLIYYYKDTSGVFHLLDGDKIATLMAKFLKDLAQLSGLNLEMRVIQTAYANGSSTKYLEDELKIPVICVPTGVKHLHHEAMKYDIGIYFEANGHGTVVFSDDAKTKIRKLVNDQNESEVHKTAAIKLLLTIDVINETVGDAISDLLLAEVILYDLDWDIDDWDAVYRDFPNRQLKVKVPNREAVDTTHAGRKCVKPEGLQEAIDSIVSNYEQARTFVRPSGTEDIIRVYSEALTQEAADELAKDVSMLVQKFTIDL